MNPEDRSCATCSHAHVEGVNLECRAHPPVQALMRHAQFPIVKPEHRCGEFERDPILGATEEIS